jgi:hypothetical protein
MTSIIYSLVGLLLVATAVLYELFLTEKRTSERLKRELKKENANYAELWAINMNIQNTTKAHFRKRPIRYEIWQEGDNAVVVAAYPPDYATVKVFDSNDKDYNNLCAEELMEQLNLKIE